MKYTTFLFLFILIFLVSCKAPLEEGQYRIKGFAPGINDGEIYVINRPDVDTIRIEKGKFLIEGEIVEPVKTIMIGLDPGARSVEQILYLYLEKGVLRLELDDQDLQNSFLSGSKTQDEQYALDNILDNIALKYKEGLDEFSAVRKKFTEARRAGASELELDKIKEEDDNIRGLLEPYYGETKEARLEFTKNNPQSYISLGLLRFLSIDMDYAEAKEIFEQFSEEIKKTDLGKSVAKSVEDLKKGVPGAPAGDFNTIDINGEPIKLDDFKGNYLLIDFWASWCVPCRKGNPHLLVLYKKYHDKGLEILGVSDDDRNPDAWRKAVEKDEIGIWHHVLRGLEMDPKTYEKLNPEKDISEGYNISSLPTKILIDPDGIVVGRFGSGGGNDEDMDEMLEEIFQ